MSELVELTSQLVAIESINPDVVPSGSGELELYDMRADPWQMDSIHRKVGPEIMAPLARRLHALEVCRGATCRD